MESEVDDEVLVDELEKIQDRIPVGFALLDKRKSGWRSRIDRNILNMNTSCFCLLGQLHDRDFAKGKSALGLTCDQLVAHGFSAPPGLGAFETIEYYTALTRAVKTELAKEQVATETTLN